VSRGILGFVGLAVTVAFAIPLVVVGVDMLAGDQPLLGGVFLGLAALMVLVEEYVVTPRDLPEVVASKAAGAVVVEDENGDGDASCGEGEPDP